MERKLSSWRPEDDVCVVARSGRAADGGNKLSGGGRSSLGAAGCPRPERCEGDGGPPGAATRVPDELPVSVEGLRAGLRARLRGSGDLLGPAADSFAHQLPVLTLKS